MVLQTLLLYKLSIQFYFYPSNLELRYHNYLNLSQTYFDQRMRINFIANEYFISVDVRIIIMLATPLNSYRIRTLIISIKKASRGKLLKSVVVTSLCNEVQSNEGHSNLYKNTTIHNFEIHQYSFTIRLNEIKKIIFEKSNHKCLFNINYDTTKKPLMFAVNNIKNLLNVKYGAFSLQHDDFIFDYKIEY
ncbi:hypothetical protein HZS_570 [Henneguya salminicola]|nr:hypothetical protein HZS_570 [Henneguya salminicola]